MKKHGFLSHEAVSHVDSKVLARDAQAAIRTGDIVPYSNIILVSGVTYP
jgi:D-ribose pyranose/furanose isomerase RbsD